MVKTTNQNILAELCGDLQRHDMEDAVCVWVKPHSHGRTLQVGELFFLLKNSDVVFTYHPHIIPISSPYHPIVCFVFYLRAAKSPNIHFLPNVEK